MSVFEAPEEACVELETGEALSLQVEKLGARIRAEAFLASTAPEGAQKGGSVSEDLQSPVQFNPSGKYNIISVPVPLRSTTCKPLFFDLFAERLMYPSMEARAQEKEQPKKGWFSGWWFCV